MYLHLVNIAIPRYSKVKIRNIKNANYLSSYNFRDYTACMVSWLALSDVSMVPPMNRGTYYAASDVP